MNKIYTIPVKVLCKFSFFFYLSIFLFFSCSPEIQKEISYPKEISYRTESVTFSPEAQVKQIAEGLAVTVMPVDAASLNKKTFDAAIRRGDYEREIAEKHIYDDEAMIRSERRRVEDWRKKVEVVFENERNGRISSRMAYFLIQRVAGGERRGYNGSEIRWFSSKKRYTGRYNPFFIRNNYLSVFSLLFENKSNEVASISIKNFQVASGNEVIYPYPMSYFEEILKENQSVINNALRYNMPDRIVITPGQKIEKFIAVPPISMHTIDLIVQYIDDEGAFFNYAYEVNSFREEKSITLEKYEIISFQRSDVQQSYHAYYIIEFEDGIIIPLKENYFYVSEERANQEMLLCGLVKYGRDNFLRCLDIKANQFPQKRIPFGVAP